MKKKLALYSLLALLLLALFPATASAAWKSSGGKTYYYQNGNKLTGFQTIGKYTYYLGSDGARRIGWQKISIDGVTYRFYFNKKNGRMFTGIRKLNKKVYLFAQDGRLLTGMQQAGTSVYYAKADGTLARGEWVNGIYYFQEDGTMARSTWINGKWVGADGRFTGTINLQGFVKEGGSSYYYQNNTKKTGFQTIEGKLYYFDPTTGAMQTGGWFTVGNYSYYASAKGVISTNTWKGKKYLTSTGAMAVGWTQIGSARYYFRENGVRANGWQQIGSAYYYFSKGALQTSKWLKQNGKRAYYVNSDGSRASGLTQIGRYYFFFDPTTGRLATGFFTANGNRFYAHAKKGYLYRSRFFRVGRYTYYAYEDGILAKGLQSISGKLYYFNKKNGRMFAGKKFTVDGVTYYFGKNGEAISNTWRKIKGKYYYFDANGRMAVSTVIDGYTVGSDGARGEKVNHFTGWKSSGGTKYYYENGTPASGWKTISGIRYYFLSGGAMATGLQEVGGRKYYFYPTGILATGVTLAVGDKEYTINSSGVITAERTINVSGTSRGSQIAQYALNFVGNKYVYGGTSLTNGADCSGFVQTVFANYGIKLLRVADGQMKGPGEALVASGYKRAVTVNASSIQPGDLVFYGSSTYASHVAIYIGGGKIVHASNSQPYPQGGIKISTWNYQTPVRIVRYWS